MPVLKTWTVMLIPHDRGGTRTITLCNLHFWAVAGLLVTLSFVSAFFYQRNAELLHRTQLLRQANRALELDNSRIPEVVQTPATSRDEVRQAETRLRSEYDASIAAITAELGDLYEMETKARNITGLAPRGPQKAEAQPAARAGKGGAFSGAGAIIFARAETAMRPPAIIYGMARPSADLIVQEIRLRTRSLGDLVRDMEVQKEKVERVPSGWPMARNAGQFSSAFGYRLDPINRRLSLHTGYDIRAPHGTPACSTARGVVISAGYDGEYGNCVIVDHGGGLQTRYAHLSKIDVATGQTVDRRKTVGRVGSTGRSTGSHLHYEVLVNGTPVNPAKYLSN
jgi:murein DD-endopeptidase MepM/ murein hydrolase activator NlpD